MILESFRNLFKIPELRTKILYTAFFLIIFRLGSHIPIPGINVDTLQAMAEANQLPGGGLGGVLTFFSSLMGGSLANCAIFSLGIMPYISASIIFSLLAKVLPSLEALSKEGPAGQRKINEYTRYATVPLCIIQSLMILKVFRTPINFGPNDVRFLVPSEIGILFDINAVIALTAGGVFLMWLGEQITEYGVGNGISLLIMAGIVASIPYQVNAMLNGAEGGEGIKIVGVLLIIFVLIVIAIVYITFGQRKIPVQQAKHVKGHKVYGGQKHFLPLKVNQAGVMPVIFASSLLIFPQLIASLFGASSEGWFSSGTFLYIFLYLILIYFFSYFWTSLMFQPSEMANNLKENGSFIPGIRPGKKTSDYLEKVMVHITFVGAGFLAAIALAPMFITMALGLQNAAEIGFAYNLGGTSILIIVGVVLDLVQKLESHLLMRHYEGFTKGKKGSGNRRF